MNFCRIIWIVVSQSSCCPLRTPNWSVNWIMMAQFFGIMWVPSTKVNNNTQSLFCIHTHNFTKLHPNELFEKLIIHANWLQSYKFKWFHSISESGDFYIMFKNAVQWYLHKHVVKRSASFWSSPYRLWREEASPRISICFTMMCGFLKTMK